MQLSFGASAATGSQSSRAPKGRPAAAIRARQQDCDNAPLQRLQLGGVLLGALSAAGLSLPGDALAVDPAAAGAVFGWRHGGGAAVSRPARHEVATLADASVTAAATADAAACSGVCGGQLAAAAPYPTSVKILMRELRQQDEALRRVRYELEATQKLLYSVQHEVDTVRAAKWQELAAAAVALGGAAAGLRSYLLDTVEQIEDEKDRALVTVELEVQERLEAARLVEIQQRVDARLDAELAEGVAAAIARVHAAQDARDAAREEELRRERAAAAAALKKERAERAAAAARALEVSRQHGYTKFKLFEAKRSLEEEREAARAARAAADEAAFFAAAAEEAAAAFEELAGAERSAAKAAEELATTQRERAEGAEAAAVEAAEALRLAEEQARAAEVEKRLARAIIEARQAAEHERALERARKEGAAAAAQEAALQKIALEAQERRAEELRKEAEAYQQRVLAQERQQLQLRKEVEGYQMEAARLNELLGVIMGREQNELDALQGRMQAAASLRKAADEKQPARR